ncbi:MAG TPA: DNA methyltransferase [Candidatus Saccharimonadales bacterium]
MDHKSIFVLGRQPAIGRAELESLFGVEHLERIGDFAVATDIPLDDIQFDRIGSSIRLARPLSTIPTTKWADIVRHIMKELPNNMDYIPEGKVKLGVSVYGIKTTPRQLLRLGLEAKKLARPTGRSVRIVPNTELTLNTAQVLHNGLTGASGRETLCIKYGNKTYFAQTVAIQNIDAYARRDHGRPKRDAYVGMLPPKLAQTIINLGTGPLPAQTENIVLDPFCGTGVVLQEALLMGYGAYGSDIEPRMIDYSAKNLEWLTTIKGDISDPTLEVGDATSHKWQHPFSVVAGEAYLGRALKQWPTPEKMQEIIGTCNLITQKFLENLATQIPTGTRCCIAMPAWQAPDGRILHLPTLDRLEILGYNRVRFLGASEKEMVYHRPDQLVARELLVITRK